MCVQIVGIEFFSAFSATRHHHIPVCIRICLIALHHFIQHFRRQIFQCPLHTLYIQRHLFLYIIQTLLRRQSLQHFLLLSTIAHGLQKLSLQIQLSLKHRVSFVFISISWFGVVELSSIVLQKIAIRAHGVNIDIDIDSRGGTTSVAHLHRSHDWCLQTITLHVEHIIIIAILFIVAVRNHVWFLIVRRMKDLPSLKSFVFHTNHIHCFLLLLASWSCMRQRTRQGMMPFISRDGATIHEFLVFLDHFGLRVRFLVGVGATKWTPVQTPRD
mmetsp:Transcript_5189/g.8561  ORF Transcript_5189/g.8561 Transcript_5189/m.8561 type:complete len:271 (-) Transcript_5189:455-1267(-)